MKETPPDQGLIPPRIRRVLCLDPPRGSAADPLVLRWAVSQAQGAKPLRPQSAWVRHPKDVLPRRGGAPEHRRP